MINSRKETTFRAGTLPLPGPAAPFAAMHIFPVKIIPAAADQQWLRPSLPDSSGRKLLVISRPVTAGSSQEATLQKMMAACKLQTGDYLLMPFDAAAPASWTCIVANGAARQVLLLGVRPDELFIQALLQPFVPNDFSGHSFIVAPSLEELEREPAAKKALWTEGLKPAFGL